MFRRIRPSGCRRARQPIGRVPGADEVARAAAFLLSPAASAIFGSTLTADGGLTAGLDFRTALKAPPPETLHLHRCSEGIPWISN